MVSITSKMVAALGLASLVVRAQDMSFFNYDQVDDIESICNVDESKNTVCYKDSEGAKFTNSLAVARLKINGAWCTGWLFGSEGHLMTNNHCINSEAAAAATKVEFNAVTPGCDDPVNMGSNPGVIVADSTTLVINHEILDFALVKVNVKEGQDLKQYGYLQASPNEVALDEPAYVVGHSYGKPRRMAITKAGAPGRITTTNYTETRPSACHNINRLGHNLDTEGGASGSPLFSAKTNQVIGLHNCGGCKQGTPDFGSNYAIKITEIVEFLKSKNLLPQGAIAGSDPTTPRPRPTLPPTIAPTTAPTDAPTSAPSTASPTPSKCTPIEDDADYEGHDLASTRRENAADCCDDCANTPGCKVFVWSNYNGGTCWLKSAQGPKRTIVGVKSAVIAGAPIPPPGLCYAEEPHYDYPGNDIKSVSNRQFKDCCDECVNTQGCTFYVWSDYNAGTCWLKSAKGEKSFFFGSRSASLGKPNAASNCRDVESNVDFVGEDVGESRGSLESCCDSCTANNECNAYSWFNGVCYLKGKRSKTVSNSNVHSARVYKCKPLQVNVDFEGNDIASAVAPSADDCCAICRGYNSCKAFSFANGVCYLKSAQGSSKSNGGVTSAAV